MDWTLICTFITYHQYLHIITLSMTIKKKGRLSHHSLVAGKLLIQLFWENIFRFVVAHQTEVVGFRWEFKSSQTPQSALSSIEQQVDFYRWLQPHRKTSAGLNTGAQRTFCLGSTSSLKPRQQLGGIFIHC